MKKALFALVLALFPLVAAQAKATMTPVQPMKSFPATSFDLQGVIEDEGTEAFACSFGKFTATVLGKQGDRIEVTLLGPGMLVNSGWLHTQVGANPAIHYLFPAESNLTTGAVISAYCISPHHERGVVTFYSLYKAPKK